jgi:hydroxymethylpyrimidine/phosphomethylpyrimidine kinase
VSAVLIIAGTDSSGAAGLARDLQTLAQFAVEATCAVTAVTAQSPHGVLALHAMPSTLVKAQIEAALAARQVGAVKIGMLANADIVAAVAASLPPRERVPCVLDPVLEASSGGALLDVAGRALLMERLLPHVTLVTPNIPELAALLGASPARDEEELLQQGQALLARGPQAVLVKGGHAQGATATDLLFHAGRVRRLSAPRSAARLRGTGCALASAIAAQLLSGSDLESACERAKEYLSSLFAAAERK